MIEWGPQIIQFFTFQDQKCNTYAIPADPRSAYFRALRAIREVQDTFATPLYYKNIFIGYRATGNEMHQIEEQIAKNRKTHFLPKEIMASSPRQPVFLTSENVDQLTFDKPLFIVNSEIGPDGRVAVEPGWKNRGYFVYPKSEGGILIRIEPVPQVDGTNIIAAHQIKDEELPQLWKDIQTKSLTDPSLLFFHLKYDPDFNEYYLARGIPSQEKSSMLTAARNHQSLPQLIQALSA